MVITTFKQFHFLLQQLLDNFKLRLQMHYRFEYENLEQQALLEAELFFKSIIPPQLDIVQQYDRMLQWCITRQENDTKKIAELKKYFQNQHNNLFAKHHQLELKMWVKATHELTIEKKQLQLKQHEVIQQLQTIKHHQLTELDTLKQAANKIVALKLLKMPSHDEFQTMACHAKAVIAGLELPNTQPDNKITAVNAPMLIDPLLNAKVQLLAELAKNIKHYEVQLKNQSIFKKVINFFSKHHRGQTRILKKYKTICQLPAESVDEKFNAIKKWLIDYQQQLYSDKSYKVFHKTCFQPLETSLVQLEFSRMHITQQLKEDYLRSHYEAINNATHSHHEVVNTLQQDIKNTQHECHKLKSVLQQFITGVNQIEDTPLGFIQSGIPQLFQQQATLKNYLKAHNPQLKVAQQLIEKILAVPRHASVQELHKLQLKIHMQQLFDAEALTHVHQAIDKLLDDTEQFGAKNNNFNFMGTGSVQYIVDEIGTKQQQRRFKNLKPDLEQRRQMNKNDQLYQEAEHLLQVLTGELNTGILNKKLMYWWEIYQKHKRINGQIPSEESENVYKNKIQYYNRLAKKLYQSGNLKLQQFIQNVMDEFFAHRSKLSLESGSMLLLIFGTEAQNVQWKKVILPQFNLQQMPSLEHELGVS